MFDASEIIAGLPHRPGVYRMLNAAGEAIYVGKAGDLKKRVASYFQKQSGHSPRTQVMLEQVSSLETTVTRSEAEALLLENNLIKSLTPRYNILFRDDKSYPYLMLSGHATRVWRFIAAASIRAIAISGLFRMPVRCVRACNSCRKCFASAPAPTACSTTGRGPCLLHQIRRCTAPCVKLVAEKDYADDVHGAELFLQGKDDEALERLISRMDAAAQRLDYEQAAVYRDQGRRRCAGCAKKQFVSSNAARDADIIACAIEEEVVCVNMVMIRGGHHLGDKNFFPRNAAGHDSRQIVEAFIGQHYLSRAVPPAIIVSEPITDDALATLLAEQSGNKVQIVVQSDRRTAGMARYGRQERKARRAAATGPARHAGNSVASAAAGARHRPRPCSASSASMSATRWAKQRSHRASCTTGRRCRSRNTAASTSAALRPGTITAAMREVLSRRYSRIVAGEGTLPDLVLIDGGKGQLGVANEGLRRAGVIRRHGDGRRQRGGAQAGTRAVDHFRPGEPAASDGRASRAAFDPADPR
jgi:excinuclease ABC subunit C